MSKIEEIRVDDSGSSLIVRDSDTFKKSNSLIGAKYKSTIIENKLLCLSLSKANEMRSETVSINGEDVKVFTSEIKSHELKKQLGISSKNLPAQIKAAYNNISTRQIGVENPENGNFAYRTLVIGGDYKNGTLKLYYNPLLTGYYKEITKNFTIMRLGTLLNFRSNHSLRLYELIKKECYTSKASKTTKTDKTVYEVPFGVAELKLSLGVVNANETAVQKILGRSGRPDYEKAVEAASEKGFAKWADFRRRCIDPAVKEINDLGEFVLDYEVEKSGQGGKVQQITFHVTYDNVSVEPSGSVQKRALSDDEKADFYDAVMEMIVEKMKMRDVIAISEAADYDIDVIREKYEIAGTQNIDNLTGWLIRAIKDDYQQPMSKRKDPKTDFENFKGREYNYDELMAEAIL